MICSCVRESSCGRPWLKQHLCQALFLNVLCSNAWLFILSLGLWAEALQVWKLLCPSWNAALVLSCMIILNFSFSTLLLGSFWLVVLKKQSQMVKCRSLLLWCSQKVFALAASQLWLTSSCPWRQLEEWSSYFECCCQIKPIPGIFFL